MNKIKQLLKIGVFGLLLTTSMQANISVEALIAQANCLLERPDFSQAEKADLVKFRDSLDKGTATKGSLVAFYAKLKSTKKQDLISMVDNIIAQMLQNPAIEKDFWNQLRERQSKNVPSKPAPKPGREKRK